MAMLNHRKLVAEDGAPERWLIFLHGILGSQENWSGFARRLVQARPDWGALLVDLRFHGRSGSALPPHDVDSCARDLETLILDLGLPVSVVSGHSFSSKVALELGGIRKERLDQIWILDADPGPRIEEGGMKRSLVMEVLDLLRKLPRRYETREQFIEPLCRGGLSDSMASWLAKNLVREDTGFSLNLDLDAIAEMLSDFHALDSWPAIENPVAREIHVVIGEESTTVGTAPREQLVACSEEQGSALNYHLLAGAGHWLHVDRPRELLNLYRRFLPS